ncbi:uncharacterized protein C20orf194 homolog isoform X2 [Branchiostoma floridae]|uniref:Uncharacterized protein C20orf194 homolog isoform X1 n=1 Tax=Branchiostoma floridae TaxID=7739 RepID=A0A9J7L2V7_BRAFL|nr:uncharacterized protein C20orf194 homolog isoform X1 [Branchiostoma floridae]XP_035674115.1 uncharacterized protein C20orf194 homolog isoform X1 [Branchiostoma floridae]XP_035674116.1 uncharacterized protein C20orf194 homolog isoform X2 [Branchiostoma floridae]
MAQNSPFRPSSGRRAARQETFSSAVSSNCRLRQVQSLLQPSKDPRQSQLDAVLCILGVDGRHSDGARELANYVLFGLYDYKNIKRSNLPEDTVDDMMLLIRQDGVRIYCNPVNYPYLLPYIAHWKNLQIFCMAEDKYHEDEEEAEEYKIRSFVAMMEGSNRVGLPYSSRFNQQQFSPMVIEKWPIIQAFALEGFGGGGFFTMKHEVFDVSSRLEHIYTRLDPIGLENLVTEQLSQFEQQWTSLIKNIDVESPAQRAVLTESKVGEPFQSYYTHGMQAGGAGGRRRAFVLFGTRTGGAGAGGQGADGVIGRAGVRGGPSLHMACQAISPRGPLSCARTYFFSSGHFPYPVSGGTGMPRTEEKNMDLRLLSTMYLVAVDAVLAAIDKYSKTLSVGAARKTVLDVLKDAVDRHQLPLGSAFASSKNPIDFTIEEVDMHGCSQAAEQGASSHLVKTAFLSFNDIPSVEHSGESLGSVTFAESFLVSSLSVINHDGSKTVDSCYTVLTANIPRYTTWMTSQEETNRSEAVETLVKTPSVDVLGKPLLQGEQVQLVVATKYCFSQEGQLHIFERGLVFLQPHWGALILPRTELQSVLFYDGDSRTVVAMLVLTYRPDMLGFLPAQVQNPDNRLVIVFNPSTRAYKTFITEVLSAWQEKEEMGQAHLQVVKELPADLASLHSQLQKRLEMMLTQPSALRKAMVNLPDLKRFLPHSSASCLLQTPVPASDLAVLLDQAEEEPMDLEPNMEEIIVTILTGIPGSHKDNLCTSLVNINKEHGRWVVLRQPIEITEGFDADSLQASLSAAVTAQRRRAAKASAAGKKKMRAVIVTPGFTDVLDVVLAVLCHPDPEVRSRLKVGAVTACVDPMNTFLEDRFLFPKVLDQCAPGWVNNIVFTSCTEVQNPQLEVTQHLIRAVNPDAAFVLAERGEVTRSEDVELILSETLFSQPKMAQLRHLGTSGWSQGQVQSFPPSPTMQDVCIYFSLPLDRVKFQAKCKALKSALSPYPFHGNVYCTKGHVQFLDSPKQYEVIHVTKSGYLSMVASETEHDTVDGDFCMVFTGCGLQEDVLKTWLRACTRQKPEKKAYRTEDSLSKQEIANIHRKHHLEPLPAGWYYNGTSYISMDGQKADKHPHMDQFVADYLRQVNAGIDNYNKRINSKEYTDLFTKK